MDLDFLTIHQIKNGDAQAAEGFIRKYYPEILRYCYLHMHRVYHDKDKLNGNGFLDELMTAVNRLEKRVI